MVSVFARRRRAKGGRYSSLVCTSERSSVGAERHNWPSRFTISHPPTRAMTGNCDAGASGMIPVAGLNWGREGGLSVVAQPAKTMSDNVQAIALEKVVVWNTLFLLVGIDFASRYSFNYDSSLPAAIYCWRSALAVKTVTPAHRNLGPQEKKRV